jgi:hypothetical protein
MAGSMMLVVLFFDCKLQIARLFGCSLRFVDIADKVAQKKWVACTREGLAGEIELGEGRNLGARTESHGEEVGGGGESRR